MFRHPGSLIQLVSWGILILGHSFARGATGFIFGCQHFHFYDNFFRIGVEITCVTLPTLLYLIYK